MSRKLDSSEKRVAMTPYISVLLPVLNSEQYLSSCLESIFSQDFDFEIILVDNGSTDNSLEIAARFAAEDSRLKIVHCAQRGVANALNVGLSHCSSEFVARIDSDDRMLPGRLSSQFAAFGVNSGIVLVSSQVQYINSDGNSTGVSNYPEGSLEQSYSFGFMNPIAHPSVMYRLSKVKEVGGYNSKFEGAEDLDLWIRLATTGKVLALSHVLTQYRIHSHQISNQKNLYNRELYFRLRNIRRLFWLRPNAVNLIVIVAQILNLIALKSQVFRKLRRKLKRLIYAR
jgi:glycosyltransferase involved in cell wall biosynthesis